MAKRNQLRMSLPPVGFPAHDSSEFPRKGHCLKDALLHVGRLSQSGLKTTKSCLDGSSNLFQMAILTVHNFKFQYKNDAKRESLVTGQMGEIISLEICLENDTR